jgi:xanthine/uracil permease
MDNVQWYLLILLGIIVGAMIAIVLVALLQSNNPTKNLCPRCENETEEERQLKQQWTEQQKGYN